MSIQTDKTRLMIKAIPHPKTEWVNGSLRFIPKNPVTIVGTVKINDQTVKNFIVSFKLLFSKLL